jgi:hypothetical protein
MSQVTLLIQPSDVVALTQFDGNIDTDNLKPMIFIAQTTHLKSFLGLKLYNKIYNDFVDVNLAGEYLIIYEDYIKDYLSYYTSSLYVDFGSYKVSENGIHKIAGENMTSIDSSEIEKLSLKYMTLIAGVQANFLEYVSDKNLPELTDKTLEVEDSFPWR